MRWILENDVFSEGMDELVAAISKAGHEYKFLKYRPFGGGGYDWGFPEEDMEPTLFYGSLNLARVVRRTMHVPGVWCNLKAFECTSYATKFGPWLINSEYAILPVCEAIRQKDWLFEQFGEDNCVFVRPNAGDKPFRGKILPLENFDLQGFEHGFYFNDVTILAVISRPKVIYSEYRVFTDGENILAASSYKSGGRLVLSEGMPESAGFFVKEVLEDVAGWKPDPIYALDIALTVEGWKVMEINSFSCSGLYNCNPLPIVRRAAELAREQFDEPF